MTFNTTEIDDSNITVINLPEKVSAEAADQLKAYIRELVEKGCYKFEHTLCKNWCATWTRGRGN